MTTAFTRIDRATRRKMERTARDLRLRGIREGLTTAQIVDRILKGVPAAQPLQAHRWAHGWERAEVSTRIDLLYEADGLAPPGISDAELCRWEHGARRPSDERIDYLCRVYATRPDLLGFGRDYSGAMTGHLEGAGLVDLFPQTNTASKADLITRVRNARHHVTMFGLTRNFYAVDEVLELFEAKGRDVPVRIYAMDPYCDSRRDRYRIEPAEAAMEDPDRYVREILRPLAQAAKRTRHLEIYLYDFPCSFAMESIDDTIRVMLYGHGKRGTDGPIFSFTSDTEYHQYFDDQLRWLDRMATAADVPEPWLSKGIKVWPYTTY
ncbi:helix-turn-helix domain-containing protein [Streptomyces silvensis]|uniref:helix-turn-helix domain-containing protein n=1 Tax=Streptomyces silvensis TaxID=1765722 RepID=UPI0012FEB6AB|nr:helix-turn-helix domain-containing protein [Streptomyces silvensis]